MRPCLVNYLLIVFLLCLLASRLPAQQQDPSAQPDLFDMGIEELMEVEVDTVYSASKHQQKVTEAPSSTTIVTAEEIKRYGYRTLKDILQGVRGFYTTDDRNYNYLGVRGFGRPADYNNRVLILLNGHRLNENVGGSSPIGSDFPLDTDLIERIEVIRGAGSSLYGSNAFFAVINVIAKKGKDFDGFEVKGETASYKTNNGRITYGKTSDDGVDLLLSATTSNSSGQKLFFEEFNDPSTNNGNVENDGQTFHNLFFRAAAGDLAFTAASSTVDKDVPTAPWGTIFNDTRTKTYDYRTLLGLDYNHEISDKLSVTSRVSYNHYNYNGSWVYDYANPGDPPRPVVNRDYWKGRWWVGELMFTAKPTDKHNVTWGSEFQYDVRQDQRNWDEAVYLDDTRNGRNWGLYVQDEYKVFEKVTISAGLRYDEYKNIGSTINPRLGLIYQHSSDTVIKLLYGEAFRAPTVYELYYNDGGTSQKPSVGLQPETIKSYELVLEHQLSKRTRATISGFYYEVENLIDLYTDPADSLLIFRNTDGVTGEGAEFELERKWDNGTRARASYCFVQTEQVDTHKVMVNSPKHLAKFNLIAPIIPERLFLGLQTQYTGKTKTTAGGYADGFGLTDITLTYEHPSKKLDANFSIYNLFDKSYSFPGGSEHTQNTIRQNERTFLFGLTYRF